MEETTSARRSAGRLKLAASALVSTAAVLIVIASIASGQATPRTTPASRAGGRAGAESCAARDQGAGSGHPTVSTRPGAAHVLVPDTPTAVLLCRYTGLTEPAPLSIPAPQFTLEAHRLVSSASKAAALARGLNAIPPANLRMFSHEAPPANPRTFACPADFDQEVVAWFEYASGPADPVTLDVNGCNVVTNGIVRRLGIDGTAVRALMALIPTPAPAQAQVQVELCGGPAPGGCRVSSVTNCAPQPEGCVSADRVAVIGAGGDKVATLHLHAGHGGPVELVPGSYTFQLLSGTGGHLPQARHVTLKPGSSASVVLTIDVP